MTRLLAAATLLLAACGSSSSADEKITPATLIPGQPSIPYPPELFTKRVEGTVLLLLLVDSSGHVIRDSSSIVKSSGHSEFDTAALQAAPSLRFTPATRNGVHITAPIKVPIQFSVPDSLTNPKKPGK